MKLKLERPLAVFDLEATGLNIAKDRIVEIAILKIHPDYSEETFLARVNPEMDIPAEVTLIHGISNEDIKDSPTFKELVPKIEAFIGDADLGGYNSNKFDIPMLAEELLRAGSEFNLTARKFIDVQNIFHKMEQRTLSAAYMFYCNEDLSNAHSALADTTATWEVLKSQLEKYPDLKGEIDFLADFSKGGNLNNLDFAGRLGIDDKGNAVYNFGKHKGKTVRQVHQEEPGYYGWFVSDSTDFPKFTKLKLKEEMEKIKAEAKHERTQTERKTTVESMDNKLDALKQKFGSK
jgi:DNA polymerase-3 subunit epsilon